MVQVITDRSLELPEGFAAQLGWRSGDRLSAEVGAEGRLVLTPMREGVLREPAAMYFAEKPPLPLTGLVVREDDLYASLCLELDVASCGDTEQEAISALQDAVDTYIQYLTEEGHTDEIYRPVPPDALREFLLDDDADRIIHPVKVLALEYPHA